MASPNLLIETLCRLHRLETDLDIIEAVVRHTEKRFVNCETEYDGPAASDGAPSYTIPCESTGEGFCQEHGLVVCGPCAKSNHRECTVTYFKPEVRA